MKRALSVLFLLLILISSVPVLSVSADAVFTGEDRINIVLDPGHGGYSIGTATASGIAEKNYNYTLALLIRDHLVENGNFNVYLTRTGDYDLELYERAEVANSYNADILISIHFDGNVIKSMRGVTAYTSVLDKYAATDLSRSITSALSAATGLGDNGVSRRKDNQGYYWNSEKQWDCQDSSLYVLSDYYGIPTWCAKFGIPSIIVEHGFFSNSADAKIITAPGTLEKMARAEADAIIAYYTNHTHVYGSAKRDFPSNCVYTGKQSERCFSCGHRRNVSSLEADYENHYWVTKESTAASCGRDGKVVRECRITQNLSDKGWEGTVHTSTEIIPAPTDHTFELTVEKAATHTVNGYRQYKCKTCSFSFKEPIYAEGHTYEFVSYKEPTCTESGGNTYKCTVCAHQYTERENARGHSLTVTETVAATCTEEGYQKSKCTVCSHEQTTKYEPLGHSLPSSAIVDSDCENDGYRKGACTRCAAEIDEVIEKKGHDMISVSKEAPTCERDGFENLLCSRCGLEEKRTQPAAGHKITESVILAPICEDGGELSLTCSECDYARKEAIEPIGHDKSAKGKTTVEAKLFSEGTVEYPCKNGCGKIFYEKTPTLLKKNLPQVVAGASGIIAAALIIPFVIILLKRKRKENSSEAEITEEGIISPAAQDESNGEAETEAETETETETETEEIETEAKAESAPEEIEKDCEKIETEEELSSASVSDN